MKEYLHYLEKLNNVLVDFQNNTKDYDLVFKDGDKTKEYKRKVVYKTDNERFIAQNQLETILQMSYLAKISNLINIESSILETRDAALIDFSIDNDILFENRQYKTIMELQGNTIKFALLLNEDYNNSEKAWVGKIIPYMEELGKTNIYGYIKCNKPKSKAYVSISKKLNMSYWHMSENEVIDFLMVEIQNGKAMSQILKKSIKHLLH